MFVCAFEKGRGGGKEGRRKGRIYNAHLGLELRAVCAEHMLS